MAGSKQSLNFISPTAIQQLFCPSPNPRTVLLGGGAYSIRRGTPFADSATGRRAAAWRLGR